MTIVDSEIWASWPLIRLNIRSSFRWQQIRNNTYSIFIIISDKALISICSICSHNPCPLSRRFGWIIIGYNDFMGCLNLLVVILIESPTLLLCILRVVGLDVAFAPRSLHNRGLFLSMLYGLIFFLVTIVSLRTWRSLACATNLLPYL